MRHVSLWGLTTERGQGCIGGSNNFLYNPVRETNTDWVHILSHCIGGNGHIGRYFIYPSLGSSSNEEGIHVALSVDSKVISNLLR